MNFVMEIKNPLIYWVYRHFSQGFDSPYLLFYFIINTHKKFRKSSKFKDFRHFFGFNYNHMLYYIFHSF